MADNRSIFCPNCTQRTSVSERTRYDVPSQGIMYEIVECNSCDFFLLAKINRNSGQIIEVHPKALPKSIDERIPQLIADDLREAFLCHSVNAYRGAAVLARRAVQTICKDKGTTKKELRDQIDELFTKGFVTKDLKDWAHEVRYVGNDAAHPNDKTVSKEDAEDILDLLESFCEVLYVTPAKAEKRKLKRLENAT